MYIYVNIYIHKYVYMYMFIYGITCMYLNIYLFKYGYIHIYTDLSVGIFSCSFISCIHLTYGVATVSRIDKITGLFCRILSLL